MRIERQHDRGNAFSPGPRRQVLGDFLVAPMNAVEVANRHVPAAIKLGLFKTSQQGHRVVPARLAALHPRPVIRERVGVRAAFNPHFQFSIGREKRCNLSRSISMPNPGPSGIGNRPAPSSRGGATVNSSMYADGVRYST